MKKVFLKVLPLLILVLMVVVWFSVARAASLTTVRDYLNRNQANLTSGVTHEIQFRPATAVSGGAGNNVVRIEFPDGDDGNWCRSNGALSLSTSGLRDGATALPGTLSASCSAGSGTSSYDTITISGVNNLNNSTTYGVIISGSTGVLGTPNASTSGVIAITTNNGSTDVDTGYVAVDIIASDQITITGTVDPTLTFGVGNTSVGFGTMTASAVRYATSNGAGSTAVQSAGQPVQLTVSTNAQDGAIIEIKDAYNGMYSVGVGATIPAVASSAVSAGSEEFGVYGKDATNLTIAEGFDDDGDSDVAISTTFQTFASSTAPISNAVVDIQPKVAVSGSTPAGSYLNTLTVIATGKF